MFEKPLDVFVYSNISYLDFVSKPWSVDKQTPKHHLDVRTTKTKNYRSGCRDNASIRKFTRETHLAFEIHWQSHPNSIMSSPVALQNGLFIGHTKIKKQVEKKKELF